LVEDENGWIIGVNANPKNKRHRGFPVNSTIVFDALYVAPDCDHPTRADAATLLASGLLGQFRRDSGWDEWHGQYPNEHWLMDGVFRRAREWTSSTG
jgi:hypothetical protein